MSLEKQAGTRSCSLTGAAKYFGRNIQCSWETSGGFLGRRETWSNICLTRISSLWRTNWVGTQLIVKRAVKKLMKNTSEHGPWFPCDTLNKTNIWRTKRGFWLARWEEPVTFDLGGHEFELHFGCRDLKCRLKKKNLELWVMMPQILNRVICLSFHFCIKGRLPSDANILTHF